MPNDVIKVNEISIKLYTEDYINDYISITDIARCKSDDPNSVIQNWMRSRDTIVFLGTWEALHNPNFNPLEFEGFKNSSGSNAFTLSPKKWIEKTNAIGIVSKPGRYGGTFAHSDIAFEFASWVSPEFKLYIIKDYQRLKIGENNRLSLDWNLKREMSKLNYRIHTDAIKENLIPDDLSQSQIGYKYASEADLLNVAVFGTTAKEWKIKNPSKKGNLRDFATIEQLLILANMESYNATLIKEGKEQRERLILIRKAVEQQIKALQDLKPDRLLELETNKGGL